MLKQQMLYSFDYKTHIYSVYKCIDTEDDYTFYEVYEDLNGSDLDAEPLNIGEPWYTDEEPIKEDVIKYFHL
jgi:hypothetical protein